MEWTLLIAVGGAWLISPVILLIALLVTKNRLDRARERLASSRPVMPASGGGFSFPSTGSAGNRFAPVDLDNLLLLRQELRRLSVTGALSRERYRALTAELDRLLARHLSTGGAEPETEEWRRRRAEAWGLLTQSMESPPGPPPWIRPDAEPSPKQVPVPEPFQEFIRPSESQDQPVIQSREEADLTLEPLTLDPLAFGAEPSAPMAVEPPVHPMESAASLTLVPLERHAEETAESDLLDPLLPPIPAEPRPLPMARSKPARPPLAQRDPDWRPAAPSALELALRGLSGWPKLIVPFLLQNIGWFIGAFCFVSGALFLIANTSGFVNALVVFASLVGATAFLIWAGYQFRRKGDALVVASSMLLTLGMLLAPLDLAVAIRLIDASGGDATLLLVSLTLTALTLAGFAWAAALSSALMDSALRGRYPWLLTALAAMQLAVPLARIAPDWKVLAGLHGALLALLALGLSGFARAWLRRLFIDQRLTTYFAAGLLVYTATVSFVHLTWSWPATLPAGYSGPFLMALCALLFQVDAAFKDWVSKYAFLSRFSFALYGLSMVAIAMALPSTPAILLTLSIGALLYAWVTWRYRTAVPLYLLLGCLAGLYGFGILNRLPPAWHELASLPGLLALAAMARWAVPRSRTIALQALLGCGGLLIGLAIWSLVWGTPGWVGMATGGTAALLLFQATRLALTLPDANPRWTLADIGVVALASAAVAYAPAWGPLAWETRTAFGLLGLAALWSGLGLYPRWPSPLGRAIWINAALTSIALALALGGLADWPAPLGRVEPILLLALAALLLLWLGLGLRRQAFFYGVLALVGGMAVLIKQGYFPGPSSGLSEFLAVLALWPFLAWLAWRNRRIQEIRSRVIGTPDGTPTLGALILTPLEQAMALLWTLGLVHLGLRLLDGAGGLTSPFIVPLAVLSGLLVMGHFHLYRWVALPVLLGLAGPLIALDRAGATLPWLGAAAVLYVLLAWRAGVALLASPLVWRLAGVAGFTAPGGSGGRRQAVESLRGLALVIAAIAVAASPALSFLDDPTPALLPALALSLLVFVLTSWEERSPHYATAALATLTLGIWLTGAWLIPVDLLGLGQPLTNTLLSLALSLVALRLASRETASLGYWRTPLQRVGGLLYLLALAGALLGALVADPSLPMLLAALIVALFPVTRLVPHGADWRGLTLALLLGGLTLSLVARSGWHASELAQGAILWGYLLWLIGNLILPRWNRRWPEWAVTPLLWPLLGLPAVLGGVTLGDLTGSLSLATSLVPVAIYLLLLMRNTAWPGMGWLAIGTLTASVALEFGILDWRPESLMLTLLWSNLLLLLARLWRRHGTAFARRLEWRSATLDAPLLWIPFGLLISLTLMLALEVLGWRITAAPLTERAWGLTGVTSLLALSVAHALWLRPGRAQVHLLILALTTLVGGLRLDLAIPPSQLPLGLALWSAALLLLGRLAGRGSPAWREALDPWLILLPAISLLLLLTQPGTDWGAATSTLLVLGVMALAHGWWQGAVVWMKGGLILLLLAGYCVWMLGAGTLTLATLAGLAPWYALQTLLIWLGLQALELWLLARAERLADNPEPDRTRLDRLQDLAGMLIDGRPWLLVLGLAWLGWHGWSVLAYQAGWGGGAWHFGLPLDALAAGASLLILTGYAGASAWRRLDEPGAVYLVALLLAVLAGYARLVLLGLAPFTLADTTVIMAGAYLAFLLHQLSGSPPLARLALLLPVLAVATTPLQLASTWSGGALLASALLYLSLASRLRNPWPLYLGVLALNGAVYLWAPLWAERYGLWQFYIAPAAISVLVLLHLHRRELRPSVLSGARLAALSLLYAGVGLDLFLRPELILFVAALGLALTGIILGIALRIRAFLYAGVAFLVLNVIGQLFRFYPEQGISRALILIGLGAVITAGMVVFNLQREAILRRVRIMRADLADWE